MDESARILSREVLMCGLKSIPFAGKAVEVALGVAQSYQTMAIEKRVVELEHGMNRMDRSVRDLVRAEMATIVTDLRRTDLDGPTLTEHIRTFHGMKDYDYTPALFEGLLSGSVHWDELKRHPQNYGTVLSDAQDVDPSKIHVFIDADKTRILELAPITLHTLLEKQIAPGGAADFRGALDIWALPQATAALPDWTSSLGMEFVLIPAGEFRMGPNHQVTITKPFYIGRYEVEIGQLTD